MQRLLLVIAALASPACLPPPEDAGEVDPTDFGPSTSAGADGAMETEGEPAAADVEWSLALPPGSSISRMIRSPGGVVVVMEGEQLEVVELSPSMESLWSVPLGEGWAVDLDALGDGTYVVAGATPPAQIQATPTVWLVTCCDAPTSQTYPQEVPTWLQFVEPFAGGLYMVTGGQRAGFLQVSLELGPPLSQGSFGYMAMGGTRNPAGNVLFQASIGGDPDMLVEVEADGTTHDHEVGGFTRFVGSGSNLTLVRFGHEEIGIRPYAGGDPIWVSIPGFTHGLLDRRERIVAAYQTDNDGPGSTVHLTEFEDDGTVLRSAIVPNLENGDGMLIAVAVGEDDAIYVAVDEYVVGGEGEHVSFLHRIAPL